MEEKKARRPNDTRHPDPEAPLGTPVRDLVTPEGFQKFPSVRYHKSGETKLVQNPEEHDELMKDKNWAESPADHAGKPAEPAPPPPPPPPAPPPPAPPPAEE